MLPHSTPWRSIFILYSHLGLNLQVVAFYQITAPKSCTQLSCSTYVPHVPPMSQHNQIISHINNLHIVYNIYITSGETFQYRFRALRNFCSWGKQRFLSDEPHLRRPVAVTHIIKRNVTLCISACTGHARPARRFIPELLSCDFLNKVLQGRSKESDKDLKAAVMQSFKWELSARGSVGLFLSIECLP
jgi:hypothetical protein